MSIKELLKRKPENIFVTFKMAENIEVKFTQYRSTDVLFLDIVGPGFIIHRIYKDKDVLRDSTDLYSPSEYKKVLEIIDSVIDHEKELKSKTLENDASAIFIKHGIVYFDYDSIKYEDMSKYYHVTYNTELGPRKMYVGLDYKLYAKSNKEPENVTPEEAQVRPEST